MIIKFHGEQSLHKFQGNLKEIVESVLNTSKLQAYPFKLRDMEVGIVFHVGDEAKMLTVEHDGLTEPFTLHIKLDEKGNIIDKADNEEESFLDDYTKAKAKNEEYISKLTEPIKSKFLDIDLKYLDTVDGGDVQIVKYEHRKTKQIIERYYRDKKLVAETVCKK